MRYGADTCLTEPRSFCPSEAKCRLALGLARPAIAGHLARSASETFRTTGIRSLGVIKCKRSY
jgi:hypothetical protein